MKAMASTLLLLFFATGLEGQEYKIDLSELPTGKVSLSIATTAHVEVFDRVFRDGGLARVQRYALILHNASTKSIIGLCIHWVLSDPSGTRHTVDYSSDSLFLVYTPVVAAGENLLVTPIFLLPESLATSGFTGAGANASEMADDFDRSKSIVASIDVAIFSDGEVIGPDRGRMVENIRSRKVVAESIVSMVHSLVDHGIDPGSKLEELANRKPSSRHDAGVVWTNRIAKMLQRSRNIEGDIDLLRALPAIDFHRD